MKQLTLFYLKYCPHCINALHLWKKLSKEETYKNIELVMIEESQEKELAASYDYYYVPSFYVGKIKLHEGTINEKQMREMLDNFLNIK